MVINGGARSGASDLATHLQRIDTNEEMFVLEMRGVVADDLDGALSDMEAVSAGACSRRPLYHANINTAPDEGLSAEQKHRAVDRLEIELGLIGQPRAVVEHVKHGRAHLHVVWLRVDLYTMEAIPDGHNYRKHELVARELEREFGHNLVQGAHIGREGVERPKRTPSAAEMLQAERSGMSPQEATARVTELWRTTDGGKGFAAALKEAGFVLARGDARDFVLIDRAGETHSLGRRVEGVKAAAVRQRMADLNAADLPNVEEARKQVRDRRQASEAEPLQQPAETPSVSEVKARSNPVNQSPDIATLSVNQNEGVGSENLPAQVNAPMTAVETPAADTEQGVRQAQPLEEDASVSVSQRAGAAPLGEGQLARFRAAFSQMMAKMLSWFQRDKTHEPARSKEEVQQPAGPMPIRNFPATLGKQEPAITLNPVATPASRRLEPGSDKKKSDKARGYTITYTDRSTAEGRHHVPKTSESVLPGRPLGESAAASPDNESLYAQERQDRAKRLLRQLTRDVKKPRGNENSPAD